MLKPIEVSSTYYLSTLAQLQPDKRQYLDDDILADHYYLVFQGLPVAGFGTNKDGRLTGLFSLSLGIKDQLMDTRVKQAMLDKDEGEQLKMNCIGKYLIHDYTTRGFTITKTYNWNPTLAPVHWVSEENPFIYELMGPV